MYLRKKEIQEDIQKLFKEKFLEEVNVEFIETDCNKTIIKMFYSKKE